MKASDDHIPLSRRNFLIRTGWLAAGATVLTSCSALRSVLPALPTFSSPELEDGLAWVQALPDGHIRFYCPRSEMGQGASLGLSQVVAEELNVGQSEIECVRPDTDQMAPAKMTVGSESIFSFFEPVSFGAARLREALRMLAAEKTGLAVAQIKDGRGGFVLPDGANLEYAAVVPAEPLVLSRAESRGSESSLPRYALERSGKYQAIGHRWKHHELEAIVTGKMVYSRDVALADMMFGQVVRPPAFEARLQSVDGRAAEAMTDVVSVVVDKRANFVGVVASSPFALPAAIEAIDVKWHRSKNISQDLLEARFDVKARRTRDDFEHTLTTDGDIPIGRAGAVHKAVAHYATSYAVHAQMEPRSGTAWVKNDKVEVWCGSQDPYFVQRRVAELLNRGVEDVVVHPHRVGGAFGGRVQCQASEEAARLSAAVGKPVRVQWDREAEFKNNHYQPMFSHFIDAGVTDDGRISHWDHDFVSSPIVTGMIGPLLPAAAVWIADQVVTDGGTARGAVSSYRLPNHRVRFSDIRTPVPTGAWRGLGAAPNTFAIESMIDELAVTSGIDPLEFRLRNLSPKGRRLANTLREVAEIANWGRPPATDTGRGMACAVYKDLTAVAVVAEVQVDHVRREVGVVKVWCVQDCGLIINTDQVENLVMGNIVWGCSMALRERITFDSGAAEQSNFDTYDVLRNDETPEMIVKLVESVEPPVGVGESALGPVAPAIANAVFAVTGRRVRSLPMSYDSVFPDGSS